MSSITNPSAGAGGAAAPVSYTIAQLGKELGVDVSTAALIKASFVERDAAVLTSASVVYLLATQSASSTHKVLLKATADGEGNNPLKAVKTFTTPVAKK